MPQRARSVRSLRSLKSVRSIFKHSRNGTGSDDTPPPLPMTHNLIPAEKKNETDIDTHSHQPTTSSSTPSSARDHATPKDGFNGSANIKEGKLSTEEAEGNTREKKEKKWHIKNPFHPKWDGAKQKDESEKGRGSISKEVEFTMKVEHDKNMRGPRYNEKGGDYGGDVVSLQHSVDGKKHSSPMATAPNAKKPKKLQRRGQPPDPTPTGFRLGKEPAVRGGKPEDDRRKGMDIEPKKTMPTESGNRENEVTTRNAYEAPQANFRLGSQPARESQENNTCLTSGTSSRTASMQNPTFENILDTVPPQRPKSAHYPPAQYTTGWQPSPYVTDERVRRKSSPHHPPPDWRPNGPSPHPRTASDLGRGMGNSYHPLARRPSFKGPYRDIHNGGATNMGIPYTSLATLPNRTLSNPRKRQSRIPMPTAAYHSDTTSPPIPRRNPNRLEVVRPLDEDIPPVPTIPPLLASKLNKRYPTSALNKNPDSTEAPGEIPSALASNGDVVKSPNCTDTTERVPSGPAPSVDATSNIPPVIAPSTGTAGTRIIPSASTLIVDVRRDIPPVIAPSADTTGTRPSASIPTVEITKSTSRSSTNFSYPRLWRYSVGGVERPRTQDEEMVSGGSGELTQSWNRMPAIKDGRRRSMIEGLGIQEWVSSFRI